MNHLLPGTADVMPSRGPAQPWRRRVAAFTLAAALAPLVGMVPVAAAGMDGGTDDTTGVGVVAPSPDQLSVTGTLRVGEQLAVDPQRDLWEPESGALGFTYRWFADEQPIEGAVETELLLTPALLGEEISVEVTGTAPEGTVAGERSASVTVAAGIVDHGIIQTAELAVSGETRVGVPLTVSTEPWSPDVPVTFEWYRGATLVGTGATYTPTASDVSSALEVVARGSVEGYDAAERRATTGTIGAGTIAAPVPTISGTAQVGKTLTAQPGTWSPSVSLTYRWLRDGAAISTATAKTYVLTPSDHGKRITVEVTGKSTGYTAVTRASTPTAAVKAGTLATATPTISGTVRVGSKVTVKPGTWTSGTTFTYQWYASGQAISGATSPSYTPGAAQNGKTLTVKVTGRKTGYGTTSRASAGVTVKAGVFTAATPKITGQVRTGATVSVSRGTWTPAASSYRYQWRVDGAAIRGATSSQYTIPSTYGGRKLSVTVTGVRTGYASKSVSSATTTVLRSYTRTAAPTISGTVRIGSTLKVGSHGTWTPTPSSWKYQWKANGVAISGATGSSYKLTSAQYGKKITVTVTAVRTGYYATSRTSAATASVAAPSPVLTKDGTYRVGTDIAPGTYVATASQFGCYWERRSTSGSSLSGVIANDFVGGQVIVTVKSSDRYFVTDGCGSWRKYYAYGSVRTSTAVDGMYRVGTSGGQLKPGLYHTSGSTDGYGCYVAALSNFSGELSGIIENDFFYGQSYWRVYSTDVGFETSGCSWRRVGS